MIRSGLLSVTFRTLSPTEVVDLVRRAHLDGIEWGGDVHVPPGQAAVARSVAALTADAGLVVAAYGSYYRAGVSEDQGLSFESVLDTAVELNAPTIRVWAGATGSKQADTECWARVVQDSWRIADLAAAAGKVVAFEYHSGTLTDSNESALRLYGQIARPNVQLYWQPPTHLNEATQIVELRRVLPFLGNVHVFQWSLDASAIVRHPLAAGVSSWRQYMATISALPTDRFALLEFVKDDSPDQFLADALTLKQLLAG